MLFTAFVSTLSLVLGVSAHLDIGGSHGDFHPARRGLSQDRRMHRHVRRNYCKAPKAAAASQAQPTATVVAQAAQAGGNKYQQAQTSLTQAVAAAPATSTPPTQNNDNTAYAAANNKNTETTSSSSTSALSSSGITCWLNAMTGIGSWFRTNAGSDSTNGRSWCQLNYQDDWMGFAPPVNTMLENFGWDTTKAGTAFCGLEAIATNPNNGNTAKIYIVDGFAQEWVRGEGAVDLTLAAFKALYGSETSDKNVVIQNLKWELTGNRKQEYSFNYGS